VLQRATGACTLQSDAPFNVFAAGFSSGVASAWAAPDEDAQCLTLARDGTGPMHGGMSLCAAAEGSADSGGPEGWQWGWMTSDDPAESFRAFAKPGAASDQAAAQAAQAAQAAAAAVHARNATSGGHHTWHYLGNGDFNDPRSVLVSGSSNIVGSYEECEGQCDVVKGCTTGLFLNGTTRHGECWLAALTAAAGVHDFCGADVTQTCYAFTSKLAPVPTPAPPTPPPTPPPPPGLRGAYGSAWVAGTVAPGATATLTLTLGWSFPHRSHFNYDHLHPEKFAPFGNQYAVLFPGGSKQAAWGDVAPSARNKALAQVVADVKTVHAPFTGAGSSLPPYLADLLVNSLSHTRNAMWFARCQDCHSSADPRVNGTAGKGFFRQFEANDCADIDSIHNDGERHIPYIMLLPDATRSKVSQWVGSGWVRVLLE
jgi:hypothetical protein